MDDFIDNRFGFSDYQLLLYKELLDTALQDAISKTDLNTAMFLVEKGANVADNHPALGKQSLGVALNIAAEAGKLRSVEFLLGHGADVNYVDPEGRTPLDNARKEHWEAVEKLLLKKEAYTGILIQRLKDTQSGSVHETT